MSYPPPSSESEEDEISPLEYARSKGLSRNYLSDTTGFLELGKFRESFAGEFPELNKDSYLPAFDLGPELKVDERLTASRDAASFVASAAREDDAGTIDSIIFSMLEQGNVLRNMKLELPLLRSNHESDCKEFGRKEGFEIRIQDVRLPSEVVDEENCGGVTFPARLWTLSTRKIEEIRAEKLSINKSGMLYYLQQLKNEGLTAEDDQAVWDSQQNYKKSKAREAVTPPLTPREHTPLCYEPSSSDQRFQVPILSDPISPTKEELEITEKKIFEEDVPAPSRLLPTRSVDMSSSKVFSDEYVKLGDIYPPLASVFNDGSAPSVELERPRRPELKVEMPITPEGPAEMIPKLVRFSEMIQDIDLDPSSHRNSPGFESRFFEEAFVPALEKATSQSEQQRLIEADAKCRVDVPILDFSKPDPPWAKYEKTRDSQTVISLQKQLIGEIVGHHALWFGAKEDALKLRWVPFPVNLEKIALEENFQTDDTRWQAFLPDNNDCGIMDSSGAVWKPEGLRILKEDEDEDSEIDFGYFQNGTPLNIWSLVKKRKMELQDKMCVSSGKRAPDIEAGGQSHGVSALVKDAGAEELGLLSGGFFSAGTSLENYLEIRGIKKAKLADSSHINKKGPDRAEYASLGWKTPPSERILFAVRSSPLSKPAALPVPSVPASQEISIIVASKLLKHRILIKKIETVLPRFHLIERDFSAYNTTAWLPGSVSRSPVMSSLAYEADMILSPSTGVILTTLQQIKQKPLPGQKAKPALQIRLEKVAIRYEKLLVLVSEGRADESTDGLGESECLAFSEFCGFAAGLETSVSVQFIGGSDETLGKWLASALVLHHVQNLAELLDEETHWELFLRRAGMNAFAAQVIIADLKTPQRVNVDSPSNMGMLGLTAFVEMSVEQRIKRFSKFCGSRVIERVSAVIDRRW